MKELGEYLKDTRRSHGVSLEEAAEDLHLTVCELENIESANTRAFKDVYHLKQLVKEYAKYLGLDPEKVQEEFNDFLFEHTSKISLDDILEAKRKKEEEEAKEKEQKIQSPYTKEYKKKVKLWPIIAGIVAFAAVIAVLFVIVKQANKEPAISSELHNGRNEVRDEYTY